MDFSTEQMENYVRDKRDILKHLKLSTNQI